jgi:hypothetical protein
MTSEKLKETRMKIAYNIIQGLTAARADTFNWSTETMVSYAYEVADEVLKQGGYNV